MEKDPGMLRAGLKHVLSVIIGAGLRGLQKLTSRGLELVVH